MQSTLNFTPWQIRPSCSDLELIKVVFIKNFKSSPCRSTFIELNEFLVLQNLFILYGKKWQNTINLWNFCFLSSKMKTMFASMSDDAINFTKSLSTLPADGSDIERSLLKYTNDIIIMCVYGIKIDSIKNLINKFYLYSKKATLMAETRIAKYNTSLNSPEANY